MPPEILVIFALLVVAIVIARVVVLKLATSRTSGTAVRWTAGTVKSASLHGRGENDAEDAPPPAQPQTVIIFDDGRRCVIDGDHRALCVTGADVEIWETESGELTVRLAGAKDAEASRE